jgi:hypothetical protein
VRQLLDGLGAPPPVHWTPYRSRGFISRLADRAAGLDYSAYLAAALLFVLSVAAGAWYLEGGGESLAKPMAATMAPSTRLDQIALTFKRPAATEAGERHLVAEQSPRLVAGVLMSMEAGTRARLPVQIENLDVIEPETTALIRGLPAEARLTDGIMIESGLWLLRPDLLSTVEVVAGETASTGSHQITIELKTLAGATVSRTQTALVINARIAAKPEPHQNAQSTDAPAQQDVRSSDVPAQTTALAPPVEPRERAEVPVQKSAPAVTVSKPRREAPAATAKQPRAKVASPRPVKRPKAEPSETAAPLSRPVTTQQVAVPRLVWPGDRPDAAYKSGPPVFLGGAPPDAKPEPAPEQPVPDASDWYKKVFRAPSGS